MENNKEVRPKPILVESIHDPLFHHNAEEHFHEREEIFHRVEEIQHNRESFPKNIPSQK